MAKAKKVVSKAVEGRYTAGPWKANRLLVTANAKVEGKFKGEVVCYTAGGDISEAEANARLISAAPEMYELLQCLEDAISKGLPQVDFEELRGNILKLVTKVEGK